MAKPPGPTNKRYRGRLRASMRSAYNHLRILVHWDGVYLQDWAETGGYAYPGQLYAQLERGEIEAALTALQQLLSFKGPIPNPPPPVPLSASSNRGSPPSQGEELNTGLSGVPGAPPESVAGAGAAPASTGKLPGPATHRPAALDSDVRIAG